MYQNKVSKRDKEGKLKEYKRTLNEIEIGYDGKNCTCELEHYGNNESKAQIEAWRYFWKISLDERVKMREEWETYYSEVKETPIYALFMEQRDAMSKNNYARVKDLSKQAKEMYKNGDHITLQKPNYIDPSEFDRGYVRAYRNIKKAITTLEQETDFVGNQEEKGAWGE